MPARTPAGSAPERWATTAPRRSAPPAATWLATVGIDRPGTASRTRSAPIAATAPSPTTGAPPMVRAAARADLRVRLEIATTSWPPERRRRTPIEVPITPAPTMAIFMGERGPAGGRGGSAPGPELYDREGAG